MFIWFLISNYNWVTILDLRGERILDKRPGVIDVGDCVLVNLLNEWFAHVYEEIRSYRLVIQTFSRDLYLYNVYLF